MVRLEALALVVGAVAGLGAWIFRLLIGFFHNLLFFGAFRLGYTTTAHTPPSRWGWAAVLVPVVGAMGVAWLVKTFAPEARGHGVPEVMEAVYYEGSRIRPVVAGVKAVASALSIGSGGSIGREGPIIQIGAAFGSTLGQVLPVSARDRSMLVAAGAAGGIAATFNAPLGGILFAVELLVVTVDARSLLAVATGTAVATFVARVLIGTTPTFDVLRIQHLPVTVTQTWALALFVPLGLLVGLAAAAFTRGIYWVEQRFDALPGGYYVRHGLGMLVVGGIMVVLLETSGHYYVQGVGYASIVAILAGALTNPWFLLVLFVLKYVATVLTLGSGASGGVFSPSMFLGASLGSAFGALCQHLPSVHLVPAVFALAGMAAAIGGSTGAVMTSIVMMTEMTGDATTILPLAIAAAVAWAVRRALSAESVYTLKVIRKGKVVPEGLEAALNGSRRVGDVMSRNFAWTNGSRSHRDRGSAATVAVDVRAGTISGVHRVADGCSIAYQVVPAALPLRTALRRLPRDRPGALLVSARPSRRRAKDLLGVVSWEELGRTARSDADL